MTTEFPIHGDGTLKHSEPVEIHDLLDVLIVGGGPAGTAAALRARECGLKALVIDRDDLMSRIRDYSKDKLIYPHYGGGDRMCFPKGGDLVDRLPFPPIDKDKICRAWKALYLECGIAARVGAELMGLEKAAEGVLRAEVFNHNTRETSSIRTRSVILAIGRGVPRTFDVPGDTSGICYRMTDPDDFVGEPACVIGGGTSAAEATIAISKAKTRAGDPTAVYWSYRGEKMPRVSKALNEQFFDAFVTNGNIRYHPLSEPAAIVTAEDHQEYLAIRVDRRRMPGRPCESLHLEFPKEKVVACIGEDLPKKFLGSLGISMASSGPGKKDLMLVKPILESHLSNVYLIGDLLSQHYFRCPDLTADPGRYEKIKHPGNIKSALRDGVLAVDVIRERLSGGTGESVVVQDIPGPDKEPSTDFIDAIPAEAPPEISQIVSVESEASAFLTRILPGGVEESEYPIRGGLTTIGRSGCDLNFPNDTLMSDHHASISRDEGGFLLRDDGSRNGVFLRLAPGRERSLRIGDLLTIGRQFLVVRERGGKWMVEHYDSRGQTRGEHTIQVKGLILGRQSPDVTLGDDKTLSRRHIALRLDQRGEPLATDLNSANGSFLKIRGAVLLEDGDQYRVGQQNLLFTTVAKATPSSAVPEADQEPAQPAAAKGKAPEEISVTFQGLEKTCPLAGRTVLAAAEENGIEIDTECEMGICGIDPVRIVSGHEHLEPCVKQEATALSDLGLDPAKHRFACVAKAKGPIVVEILKQ